MATAVLSARDHLAQDRYGHQSRMMSGMMYPLGGLPRSKRKVKMPEKPDERPSERKKVVDRKTVEKKFGMTSNSHGEKNSSSQKKSGVITILQRPQTNVITILQRPQTKEAAVENNAKITGRPIEIVAVEMMKSIEALYIDRERKLDDGCLDGSPISAGSTEQIVSNPTNRRHRGGSSSTHSKVAAAGGVHHRGAGQRGQMLSDGYDGRHNVQRSGSLPSDFFSRGESGHISPDLQDELYFSSSPPKRSERWAGAAYTNSPPPSTLPFPTFPIQRVKSSLTEVQAADVALLETQDAQSPTKSPSSFTDFSTASFFSGPTLKSLYVDTSSATKELRRMLNLDVKGTSDGSVEAIMKPKDARTDTATQSLKRILQLG